jgi:hypothetical protein
MFMFLRHDKCPSFCMGIQATNFWGVEALYVGFGMPVPHARML